MTRPALDPAPRRRAPLPAATVALALAALASTLSAQLNRVWSGLGLRLSLDQALLATLEGEARWAQREGHVAEGARPNVLTRVHPGPLKSVDPAAVGMGG